VRTGSVGAILAALAISALGIAACGGEESGTTVTKVAIATPGPFDDMDWTRNARAAFEAVVERRGLTGRTADGVAPDEARATLTRLADEDPQLLIAHDADYAEAAVHVASATGVPVLVWGPAALREPGLVANVEIDGGPGGYLAGYLLNRSVGAERVGILIGDDGTSWDAATWNRLAGGFAGGVRHATPRAALALERIDDATAATMRRATTRGLRAGTPAFLALGGASAAGALEAITRSGANFVGAVGDKPAVDPGTAVVIAVAYDFEDVFRRAIADVRAGRFGERSYTLALADGGLRVVGNSGVPMDAHDDALDVRRALGRGELDVPETATPDALDALLAGGAGRIVHDP
jgi:basic membrane lipoprotein Med (substrate-binding protein (PBP1-ABC) superfamily)